MSKLTKLVNSPDKFFKDFLIKRINSIGLDPHVANQHEKNVLDGNLKKEIHKKINDFDFNAIFFSKKINTVIHCGEGSTVGFNIISPWLSYLEGYKENFVLLVRNHDLFNKLKSQYKGFNIAYAKSPTDVEDLFNEINGLKNICFVSNTANNIHLIRFIEYKHIFIGHFDEDRQPSLHKYFKAYDECWFYSSVKMNMFEQILSPSHLTIKVVHHPERVLKCDNDFKNIIYWALDNDEVISSSLFSLKRICNLGFLDKKYLNVYVENNDKSVVDIFLQRYKIPSFNNHLLLKMSDIIIMDYAFDKVEQALQLGIPVVIYMPIDYRKFYSEEDCQIIELCYQFKDIEDLDKLLGNIVLNDTLKKCRLKFIENHYGSISLEKHNFKETIDQLFLG